MKDDSKQTINIEPKGLPKADNGFTRILQSNSKISQFSLYDKEQSIRIILFSKGTDKDLELFPLDSSSYGCTMCFNGRQGNLCSIYEFQKPIVDDHLFFLLKRIEKADTDQSFKNLLWNTLAKIAPEYYKKLEEDLQNQKLAFCMGFQQKVGENSSVLKDLKKVETFDKNAIKLMFSFLAAEPHPFVEKKPDTPSPKK